MENIQVSVEGDAAVEAVQELFSMTELQGGWSIVSEHEKEGTLAVVAIVVGVVAGVIQTADIICKWYQEYRSGKSGKKIQKVLIIGCTGERLLLEGASIEQIQKILRS